MVYGTSLVSPVFGLRREIDRLFDDMFTGRGSERTAAWAPVVDIRENENELLITAELPGIDPDHVEVTCDNGVLTIRGEKQQERKENEEGRFHLIERTYGTFSRSFQLPQGVDESKIDADFDRGVLNVRIPKAALPQPRRIQVRGMADAQRGQAPTMQDKGAVPQKNPKEQR